MYLTFDICIGSKIYLNSQQGELTPRYKLQYQEHWQHDKQIISAEMEPTQHYHRADTALPQNIAGAILAIGGSAWQDSKT